MASTVLPNGIIVPEKFSRDWYADLYHNWQELDNLLGGGTPKDGTLTIQKNGDTVGTFSANQSTDETVNIEVPTATSELTNDSGFITGVSWNDVTNKPSFATVATSGSYNDLSNKPTIPTVNDATLTIQQNGTAVDSFTANSSTDKTVNIQCVDLSNNQTIGGIKTFSNAPVVSSINLDGKTIDTDANDNMTFNGRIVDTIEEQGEGYIRYSNGIQICWGVVPGNQLEPFSDHYGKLISYPRSFLANTEPIVNFSQWRALGNLAQNVNIYDASVSYVGIETDMQAGVYYIVFGKWK